LVNFLGTALMMITKKSFIRMQGFTLMELLIVMAIIGLLATLVAPGIIKQFGGAQYDAAKARINVIENAIGTYRLDVGKYPRSLEELVTNSGDPKWKGPYLKESQLTDPWGNKYQFKRPGSGGRDYDLLSFGADGAQGGEGDDADITNW
jgi:general secretion pathway protein G